MHGKYGNGFTGRNLYCCNIRMRPIRPGIVEGDLVVTRPFEECVITGRFDNSGHTHVYRLWRLLHPRLAPPSKGLAVERNWLS